MLNRRSLLLALGPMAFAFPGSGAPDFRGKTLTGETFTKASLKGKPVLIQFWATWCGYCRRDQPAVEAVVQRYRDKLVVLAVNMGEERRVVERYLQSSPRKSKIVLTPDTNLPAIFDPQGFPYYVLLDAEGKVVAEQPGAGGKEGLQELLERVGFRDDPGMGV